MNTQSASTIVSYIQCSREILCRQLKYRGFDVEEYENTSIEDIQIMHSTNQLDMVVQNEDSEKTVYVKYFMDKALRENHIQTIHEEIQEDDKTKFDIIIVAKEDPNKSICSVLNHLYQTENIYIAVFGIKTLQYNILEHELVPKHEVIDKNSIYKKYNIQDDSQVPEISRFDPVAQAIGLRPKELCEITRKSKTSIESKYYRICV
jgi:DNA-directed RNA polymerase subunit H (RpoH/RPB5)